MRNTFKKNSNEIIGLLSFFYEWIDSQQRLTLVTLLRTSYVCKRFPKLLKRYLTFQTFYLNVFACAVQGETRRVVLDDVECRNYSWQLGIQRVAAVKAGRDESGH